MFAKQLCYSELKKRAPAVSDIPQTRLTPPTAWLMRAKQGQVLCPGSGTVSGHRGGRQAPPAQKHRPLAPCQWMASSRGCRAWPTGSSQGQCSGRSRGLPPGPGPSRGFFLSQFLGGSSDTLSSFRRQLVVFSLCQLLSIVSKFHWNIFIGSKHEWLTLNGFSDERLSKMHTYFTNSFHHHSLGRLVGTSQWIGHGHEESLWGREVRRVPECRWKSTTHTSKHLEVIKSS